MNDRIVSSLDSLRHRVDLFSERELAATLIAAISIAGPAIGFFTYLLPHPDGTDYVVPSIAFAISIAAGTLLWIRRRTVSWVVIAVVVALGSMVVTLTMLAVPGRSAVYVTYYVWLGIFAFYFLRPKWALAQVALIAVLYAVAVADDSPPGAVEIWVNGVATTLGVGLLVLALRSRIAGLVDRLESAATTDELTGLPNRRAFDEQLARELTRSAREGGDLSLALLDLDHFKQLNDTVGHLAGDRALQALAKVLRVELRPTDWPARIGGDEFAVLLPGVSEAAAEEIAGRLLAAIQAAFAGEPVPLHASVGVAAAAGRGISGESLLAEADDALYLAKGAGGDRVRASAALFPHVRIG